jgi:hypothetical protein
VREIEIEGKVQKLGRGERRGSSEIEDTAGINGGATSSGLGSLAAERPRKEARVHEGVEAFL